MLRFMPEYHNKPWGGRRLETILGRALPAGPVGEAWELVDLDGRSSAVVGDARRSLAELWHAGELGGSGQGRFPFLLKWLDTHDWLSVQVHPDAEASRRLSKASPKTEAWFVAHAEPNATIKIGHYPGLDADALAIAAGNGTVANWMREIAPAAGHMVLVPAGTLHAIGPGYLLLEVQQPSDTTFRLYDWGRKDANGQPRPLHLEAGLQAVRYDTPGRIPVHQHTVVGPCFHMQKLARGSRVGAQLLRVFVGLPGATSRVTTEHGERHIGGGEVVVFEAGDGPVEIQSGEVVWLTEPLAGAGGAVWAVPPQQHQ